MPRGRKPANSSGSNVDGDSRADLIDDFEAQAERLDAADVEMLTGHRPARSASFGGELGYDSFD